MGADNIGKLLQMGGKVASGISKRKALRKEAREVEEETKDLANMTKEEAERVKEKQKMAFIKNGVDIASGTALNRLTDTKARGGLQAGRISERGRKESKSLKRGGRNALIKGIFQGTSTGISILGSRK